jgi:hypothetical protein
VHFFNLLLKRFAFFVDEEVNQMKKLIFHLELLTSLIEVTGKEKRAAKILTPDQQQALQGPAACWNFFQY